MSDHIVLTSHARRDKPAEPIHWGAPTAAERGPVIASLTDPALRNVIGTHSGAYAIYRALAVASGRLQRDHRADLTDTAPAEPIGPHAQWADPDKIVSLDPWGHLVSSAFADRIAAAWTFAPPLPSPVRISTCRNSLRRLRLGGLRPTAISCTPMAMCG